MSDGSIQVGDEVSWNWGGGHPKGKVAEVKTSGKLEIESKGKSVHKNADESNPAVRIERNGNDVVKRASELNRLRGGGDEEAEGQEGGQGRDIAAEESGATAGPSQEAQPAHETGDKQATEKPARGGRKERKQTTSGTKKTGDSKRGRKKVTAKEAAVGEKRKREEGEAEEGGGIDRVKGKESVTTTEQDKAEKGTGAGKKAKKAKIVAEGEQAAEPTSDADVDSEHHDAAEEAEKHISETAETSRTEAVEA
ncbi:hypothetical protein AX14_001559 [Amanita brunnescens Koide BX004]|nr:hypothetical protein AX14_001559 [Amanita brunnescens Koide BX004]